jgi:hypothetical protein
VCQVRGVLRGALCPCHAVVRRREMEALQAAVQDAGDRPGAGHRGGGDLVDELADVVPGELDIAQLALQYRPGGFPLVPPGFGFGEPGRDLLVDVREQGLPGGGGPQVERVAGSGDPVLGVAELPSDGQVTGLAVQDAGEDGFGRGLLVRLVPGRGGRAGDHVRGVGFPARVMATYRARQNKDTVTSRWAVSTVRPWATWTLPP